MSSTNLANLERTVEALLAAQSPVTPERIREIINAVRVAPVFSVSDEEAEHLARSLEVRHDVTMPLASALTERDYKPWLETAQAQIQPYYWERYRKLLVEKKLSSQVISTLGSDTDRILGYLENPTKEGRWSRRGMVVGHVQSGKTSNYIGLISKAADAGYRLIVIIAGVHNNLRNQTQRRVDEGFVGRDSARLLSRREDQYIGVGRYDATRRPATFTNSLKDFNKEMATSVGIPLDTLKEPAVFVIKKNSSTLKNLLEWLQEHSSSRGGDHIKAPMLIIDDEADNASINVRYGKNEVSRINGQIRDLLNLFARSCYVGYTATPFANIFIDPETDDEMRGADLFPRHFIVSLDPPSNYFGPDRVFRENPEKLIRSIDDADAVLPLTHKIDHIVVALPESLLEAVRVFLVGRAIRLNRGHVTAHCSMLVNASRFTNVQTQLRTKLETFVDAIRSSVRLHAALPEPEAVRDPEMEALRRVWLKEFGDSRIQWSTVQGRLLDAVAPVKVVEVNNRSHGTLNYDDYTSTGLNVIAVGGYSLSRGLTLEGLMVSYFLRNSMMYDTLMQMGRWFGYRPDYEDLCRVWMPEEAEGWYSHIAESIEMLRKELRTMAAAGATPEEFGLKVRAHPDTLIVTARNKMGAGEKVVVRVGLGNQFVETATLRNDPKSLESNRLALQAFRRTLEGSGLSFALASREMGGYLIRDVDVQPIKNLLAAFRNHPASLLTEPGPLVRYIEDREADELALWDVFVPSLNSPVGTIVDDILGVPVACQQRTAGKRSDETTLRITDKQRVASRGIERTGLDKAAITDAERAYRERKGLSEDESPNYPDLIYREKRERALLVLHLLRIQVRDKPEADWPKLAVFAWSISFPRTERPEERVEYVVTATWLRENYRDELAEEEFESDDNA